MQEHEVIGFPTPLSKKITAWKDMCESSNGIKYNNILCRRLGKHPPLSATEFCFYFSVGTVRIREVDVEINKQ